VKAYYFAILTSALKGSASNAREFVKPFYPWKTRTIAQTANACRLV